MPISQHPIPCQKASRGEWGGGKISLVAPQGATPRLWQDLAPVLGGDELRKMFGIAGGNHHVRWCRSKRECLGGEDYINVEIFGIGCGAPSLSRLCPKLRG